VFPILYTQKFSPQPAEREISCPYSDSSLAHLFYYHFPPLAALRPNLLFSNNMRFAVYSVVKSPLFASARQSVCQKRRAAAHYKELLYIASGVAFFVPRAFFRSLSFCGIVFSAGVLYIAARDCPPARARFIYIRRIMFYITLESLIFWPCAPGLFYLFYSL
jgi:hypothetical protein